MAHHFAVTVKEGYEIAHSQAELEAAVVELVLEVGEQQVVEVPHAVNDFRVRKQQMNETCMQKTRTYTHRQ